MSGKSGYPGAQQLDINGVGLCMVAGSFTTANGTVPVNRAGRGWTVVRDGEGKWTVTLSRAFMEIVSIVVSLARETLPGGTTTGTTELVQCFVDQDTIDTDSFQVQVGLTNDIATGAFVYDDQPGAEIHFQLIGRYSSIDY